MHLRLIVPVEQVAPVLEGLQEVPGVAHLIHVPGGGVLPAGDVILCDVAREATDRVVEWLQDLGVHHAGAISVERVEAVVSDAAAAADLAAPGRPGDALVWEELEARARNDADLTASFLLFITIAAVISGAAILLDSPILMVGAMAVGPEYGPLAAACVAATRRRATAALRAGASLAIGLAVATLAALVATIAFRVTGLSPDSYELSDRQLTAFIAHPDGMAAVVAVLAGIVGMLSLTQGRSSALVGVLVAVTTLPAAANVGVAAAYQEWGEVGGAALQLVINLAGLFLAGTLTLVVQRRLTHRHPSTITAR